MTYDEFRELNAKLLAEENELKIKLGILKKQALNNKMREQIAALEKLIPQARRSRKEVIEQWKKLGKKGILKHILKNMPSYLNKGLNEFDKAMKAFDKGMSDFAKPLKSNYDGSHFYQEPKSKDHSKTIWGSRQRSIW